MKFDTSGIAGEHLAQFVSAEYGLEIGSLTFRPKGEASYSYLAEGKDGAAHLVKAQETARAAALDSRLRAVSSLRSGGGIREVVAPYENQRGTFIGHLGNYTIAVFPFIASVTAWEEPLSDEQLLRVASIMAALHRSGAAVPLPVPREDFANPFEAPIRDVLRMAETEEASDSEYQRRVKRLVLAERSDLLATLDRMRQLQARVLGLDLDWGLTHGDPNMDNILVDRSGDLHLVDWDDLALGPVERDLVFFTEEGPERTESFLRRYAAAYGRP